MLSYDVVIATRNRPGLLALSLPLILAQTRPPTRVVVVDGSDDPAPVADLLARHAGGPVPVERLGSPPGLTRQRNAGLARTGADIVLFPDDDSLLYPDAAAEIMAAYERDAEGAVAAVCAAEAERPPPGALPDGAGAAAGGWRRAAGRLRQRLVRAGAAGNPFLTIGDRLNARHRTPDWLAEQAAVAVPYMTGFRMSFRRSALAAGFDETLARYGWFEDIDASFSAMRHGLVIGANRALIYHHRVAGPRGAGRTVGLWAVLNRGYVAMKHVRANPDVFPDPAREALRLRAFCLGRLAAYGLGATSPFGRARLAGAAAGFRRLGGLVSAPGDTLADRYRTLAEEG